MTTSPIDTTINIPIPNLFPDIMCWWIDESDDVTYRHHNKHLNLLHVIGTVLLDRGIATEVGYSVYHCLTT